VDRLGAPLALLLSGANRNDSKLLEPLLDAVRPVQGPRGRPRRRPDKLHADKGYDHAFCREACRARGVADRIARRGQDSSKRLGRHRWVVERAFAHLRSMRRLGVRWEREAAHWLAFATLGCAVLCLRALVRLLGL
jgi:transposase